MRETFVARWAENDPEAYLAATRSALGWNLIDRLGDLQCPVLALSSDQDYWPVEEKARQFAAIPDARLVTIPDSRHALPLEKPDAVNTVLAQFLDDCRNRR